MALTKITEARLREMKRRQWEQRWGPDYISAIFADPKEAPRVSTASILHPMKLGERAFHTLSAPETYSSLLALHHPACWDIHEQRILYPMRRAHYLYGHARARGATFKFFEGTLSAAERTRVPVRHPRVRLKLGDDPCTWPMAPFLYTGDLLLFMQDADGPYCVNWSVKDKFNDFRQAGPQSKPRPLDDLDDPHIMARHELEVIYYGDAGIRTQQVAGREIDEHVKWNLREVFLDDSAAIPLDEKKYAAAISMARDHIGCDIPLYIVMRRIADEFHISPKMALKLIDQGIWRRQLRVDLFRPLRPEKPLRPEVVDVLVHYGAWFKR